MTENLDLLPLWVPILLAGVVGTLIGSFLNVVIWRVPRGLSVVSPPSACPRCERPIAWYDNIPVVSYLILRGKCRHCGQRISARYPAVELATGLAFAGVAAGAIAGVYPAILFPLLAYWAALSIALTMIDLDHQKLPNVLTMPAYVVTALLLVVASVVTGEYGRLVTAAVGFVALLGFYLLLAFGYRGGMGFGDVKLSGSLGMLLGWLGWAQLAVGGFSAFLVGGVVGIVLMIAQRAGRKTRIPFGPFMLAGAWIGIFAGASLADFYLALTGLA